VFAGTVIEQLGLIAPGQAAGLSLDGIRLMLTPGAAPDIDRSLLSRKSGEIDVTIKQLRAVSRGLRHAAKCPAASHAECPTFRHPVGDAAFGALGKTPVPLTPKTKRSRRKRAG
jgi:hypothetical protein